MESQRKYLLDTSVLFPVFGVDVGLDPLDVDGLLRRKDVFYSPLSLVEAKFLALRLYASGNRKALERYRSGLEYLLARGVRAITPTSPAIERIADSLLVELPDYFDRMLLAAARALGLKLVTVDQELLKYKEAITPDKVV